MKIADGCLYIPFLNEEPFALEWIVFGSKESTDIDLMVRVPIHLVQGINEGTLVAKVCSPLDKLLHEYFLQKSANDNTLWHRPMNCCLGSWNDTGSLLWVQKGSELAETNNSLLLTFGNHPPVMQYYNECPLHKLMPRRAPPKVLYCLRMLLGKLSKTRIPSVDAEVDCVVRYLLMPEFAEQRMPDDQQLLQYVTKLFGGATQRKADKGKRNKAVRSLPAFISACHGGDNDGGDKSTDNQQHREALLLLRAKVLEIRGFLVSPNFFAKLVRYSMQDRTMGHSMGLLCAVQLTHLEFPAKCHLEDRLKVMAYQLAQTCCLLDGHQLFDKGDLGRAHPSLMPYLRRQPCSLQAMNEFVHDVFLPRLSSMIDSDEFPEYTRETTELDFAC